MRSIVIGCALLVACGSARDSGGGGGTAPSATEPSGPALPRVTDSDSAKASAGQKVRVIGTALNAKLGPVVSTGSGLVIYCMGREEWSAGQVGNQVSVTGTLEQTDEYRAQVSEDGAQTAGTGGDDWVIRQCTVEGS